MESTVSLSNSKGEDRVVLTGPHSAIYVQTLDKPKVI